MVGGIGRATTARDSRPIRMAKAPSPPATRPSPSARTERIHISAPEGQAAPAFSAFTRVTGLQSSYNLLIPAMRPVPSPSHFVTRSTAWPLAEITSSQTSVRTQQYGPPTADSPGRQLQTHQRDIVRQWRGTRSFRAGLLWARTVAMFLTTTEK